MQMGLSIRGVFLRHNFEAFLFNETLEINVILLMYTLENFFDLKTMVVEIEMDGGTQPNWDLGRYVLGKPDIRGYVINKGAPLTS